MLFNFTNASTITYVLQCNITNATVYPELGKYSTAEAAALGIFLALVILLAISGNILVCIAVFTDRNLRKLSNFYIVSLAIADLLVAIVVMTFAVANDIMGYWIFGETFCSVWMSFDVMSSTASILNLCAISLDRYTHIKNPLTYEVWMTQRKCVLAISIVWILSGLISFLPIHLGWHQIHQTQSDCDNLGRYNCILALNPLYAVISSLVSFYVPCIVMLILYCKLYQYARKHVRSIRKTWTAERLTTPNGKSEGGAYKVSDHKAAITLGIIMGVFLFCWSPFFAVNIIGAFCPPCIPPYVFMLFTWLGYTNSTLNPIIYSIFNQEFREAFKKVLMLERFRHKDVFDMRRAIPLPSGDQCEYGTVSRTIQLPSNCEYGTVSRKNSQTNLVTQKITSL